MIKILNMGLTVKNSLIEVLLIMLIKKVKANSKNGKDINSQSMVNLKALTELTANRSVIIPAKRSFFLNE